MNFVAREQIGLGQKVLHDVYSKEEERKWDLVDYALLDSMHEMQDRRYGKANKKRELDPNMYELLTGGYVQPEYEAEVAKKRNPPTHEMTEEELKQLQEAILRKEIAKGKWMTETRDHFRKFTDEPEDDVYYIGNHLVFPKRLANTYTDHYLTSYKRDYGEEEPEENPQEDDEAEPIEEESKQKKPERVTSKSPNRDNQRLGRSRSRERGPRKKKNIDIKKWIYERNKAKYGKPLPNKAKMSKKEREEYERLQKEISMSRWKPDTHLRSLHGKPIFHPFGKGNTDPTVGGVVYGHYLLTHNIHPHSGENRPIYQQVYNSAHNKAFENGKPDLEPTRDIPQTPKISKEQMEELKNRNPTMPDEPSKHLKRNVQQLDLMKEVCFASKHSTSHPSEAQISEIQSKGTPSRRSSVQRTPKEEKKLPFTSNKTQARNQSVRARPKTAKVQNKSKTTPVQQEAFQQTQQALSPQLAQNLKATGGKGSAHNTKKNTEDMKTMASTGKFAELTRPAQILREQSEEKEQTEKSSKSRTPSLEPERQPSHQPRNNEERDIEYNDQDETQYMQEGQEDDQDVNPTVFPVGFPFWFCPSSDHKINMQDKDPRSYQFVPSCWTKRIPAAGRNTYKGENLYNVILGGGEQ